MAKSISWSNPIEHVFRLLKTKLKAERHTNKNNWSQLQKGLAKHHKGGNPVHGEVHDFQIKAVIVCKDSIYAKQNMKYEHFIYDYIYLSNHIWALERGLCKKIAKLLCYIVQPPD